MTYEKPEVLVLSEEDVQDVVIGFTSSSSCSTFCSSHCSQFGPKPHPTATPRP